MNKILIIFKWGLAIVILVLMLSFTNQRQENQFISLNDITLKKSNDNFINKKIVLEYLEEKEITFGFCFENEFISAYDSFLTQEPSLYSIQALTDITMWSISHQDIQEIYSKSLVGNTIGRLSSERLYLIKSKREQSLLNETAEQRYLNLFTERPNLIKEIPLKYIASYIGVTAQALSRIRKRIS